MTVVVIKSDYLLETPRISKYSSASRRKVKIFDRCGQPAGNPLKVSDILEGEFLQKEETMNLIKFLREKLYSLIPKIRDERLNRFDKNLVEKTEKEWRDWDREWYFYGR